MATQDFDVSRYFHLCHEIQRINQVLARLDVRVPSETEAETVLLQFNSLDVSLKQPDGSYKRGDLEIAGRAWNEARDFWRKEVLKQFPLPANDPCARRGGMLVHAGPKESPCPRRAPRPGEGIGRGRGPEVSTYVRLQ